MSFLDQNLLPGEEIIYRTRKHYILFLVPVLLTIATFYFLLNQNPYVAKVAFLPAIAAIISWANQFLTYVTSEFAVTNKRIRMREGFFYRHTNETRLATIADVSVNQSLVGQMLNFGTIFINAFGGGEDPFTQIASPNEFQRQLQAQLDLITRQKPPV
ncbi:MAG: PH domain-containing protein [Gammaproteobacteria bacterium]